MKKILLIACLFYSFFSHAQNKKLTDEQLNKSGASKIVFVKNIQQAKDLAKTDSSNKIFILLLQSGISPISYSTDKKFEKKYNVSYYDFGCTCPEEKFLTAYNEVIFEYLNRKVGTKWMSQIRKDVIGLKNYPPSN